MPDPARSERPPPAFADVDADAAASLVAMMDATDHWSAVQAARSWVLDRAAVRVGSVVVDVGCGPGTFGAGARAVGAVTVDIDRSASMVGATRRRHPGTPAVLADVGRLPIRDGAADLVHAERVLQWTVDPGRVIGELCRVTAPGGLVAITDTDWGTFVVDHPDATVAARLSAAAHRWVPRPALARSIPRLLREAGVTDVAVRADAVAIGAWDPDHPDEDEGPPGLPLRRMADAVADRSTLAADVGAVAELAREGSFFATLTLVTAVGRTADARCRRVPIPH